MEMALFLPSENVVWYMTRAELKCLDKNAILFHFSRKQFNIVK
jgi:hypothetical protein